MGSDCKWTWNTPIDITASFISATTTNSNLSSMDHSFYLALRSLLLGGRDGRLRVHPALEKPGSEPHEHAYNSH